MDVSVVLGQWCIYEPLTHLFFSFIQAVVIASLLCTWGVSDSFLLLNSTKNALQHSYSELHALPLLPVHAKALLMETTSDGKAKETPLYTLPVWKHPVLLHRILTLSLSRLRASSGDKRLIRFLMRAGPSLQSSSHREQGVASAIWRHKPSSPKSCSWILAQSLAALVLPHLRLWEAEAQRHLWTHLLTRLAPNLLG